MTSHTQRTMALPGMRRLVLLVLLLGLVPMAVASAQQPSPTPKPTITPVPTVSRPSDGLTLGTPLLINVLTERVDVPFAITEAGYYRLTTALLDNVALVTMELQDANGTELTLFRDEMSGLLLPGAYTVRVNSTGLTTRVGRVQVGLTRNAQPYGPGTTTVVEGRDRAGHPLRHTMSFRHNDLVGVVVVTDGGAIDELIVYDADGHVVARSVFDRFLAYEPLVHGLAGGLVLPFIIPQTGTYTFEARPFASATSNSFRTTMAVTHFGRYVYLDEPVSLLQRDATLPLDAPATFAVQLQRNNIVRFVARAASARSLNPRIEVRATDGTLLARNDDTGRRQAGTLLLAATDALVPALLVPQDATYIVEVAAETGSGAFELYVEVIARFTPLAALD